MAEHAALDRPRPILEAIQAGMWKTWLGGAVTAAVAFGILNTQQATAVNNLVAAVVTLVTVATSLAAQLHVLHTAEPQVTPVSDPQDDAGHKLVASTGAAEP
jgi:hypothetical protein